jgi:hypothetical protein
LSQVSRQPASTLQEHCESPEQLISQPPWQVPWHVLPPMQFSDAVGPRSTSQALPPLQMTPESAPTLTLHALVPSQVMLESLPAVRSQVLCPTQEVLHPVPQEPLHAVLPAHWALQFAPHATLQVFWFPHARLASLGKAAPGGAPNVQVPPAPHVQLLPEHWHGPTHETSGTLPPQDAAHSPLIAPSAKASKFIRRGRPMGARLVAHTRGHGVAQGGRSLGR